MESPVDVSPAGSPPPGADVESNAGADPDMAPPEGQDEALDAGASSAVAPVDEAASSAVAAVDEAAPAVAPAVTIAVVTPAAVASACTAAWEHLGRCIELLKVPGGLRSRMPLLYLQQTLEELQAFNLEDITRICGGVDKATTLQAGVDADADATMLPEALREPIMAFDALELDGASAARWLSDMLSSLLVTLNFAEELSTIDEACDFQSIQIMLWRLEHRLAELLQLLRRVLMEGLSWAEALTVWQPEELLSSGDLVTFWRNHFPQQFRVGVVQFFEVLRTSRGVSLETFLELLPWLAPGVPMPARTGDDPVASSSFLASIRDMELELADIGLTLDSLGLSRGLAFCTSWEELCGHAFITAVWSEHERVRRGVMSAADVVLARKEQQFSVLLPGWSRDVLRRNRPFLRAIMTLGAALAFDAEDGLVVQFDSAEVAAALLPPAEFNAELGGGGEGRPHQHSSFVGEYGDFNSMGGDASVGFGAFGGGSAEAPKISKTRTRLGEVLANIAQEVDSLGREASKEAGPEIFFQPPGRNVASRCLTAEVAKKYQVRHARDRHHTLTSAGARRLWEELSDFLQIFEVLGARQRAAFEKRVRSCDPAIRSEAWPKLQRALRDQKIKEEQVILRKQQLYQMEDSSNNPDQIAHIRVLLQEVAEAEEEKEQSSQWLANQESKWQSEEEAFQRARRRQDLACRQRSAAIGIELRDRQRQRGELRTEMARVEHMLLDLEETFSTNRQRLHEYDQELTAMIHEKENLLDSLTQALAQVKEVEAHTDQATATKTQELERMRRVLHLHAEKAEKLEEIDKVEKKLDTLRVKHNVTVVYAA